MRVKYKYDVVRRQYGDYTYFVNAHGGEKVFSHASLFADAIAYEYHTFAEIVAIVSVKVRGSTPVDVIERDLRAFTLSLGDDYLDWDDCAIRGSRSVKPHMELSARHFLREHWFKDNPTLVSLHVDITSRCNEKCRHCYLPSHRKELPFPEIRRVLAEFVQLGGVDVVFSGGECFAHPQIKDVLDFAVDSELIVDVASNLTLLNPWFPASAKGSRVRVVQTTIFSMDATVHDYIGQLPGGLARTLKNVRRIRDEGVEVHVNCPLLTYNKNDVFGVFAFCRANGIQFNLSYDIMKNFASDAVFPDYRMSIKELEDWVDRNMECNRDFFNGLGQGAFRQKTLPGSLCCGAGIDVLAVGADGFFYPCSSLQQYPVGKITEGVENVWSNSLRLAQIRALRRSDIVSCPQCEFYGMCNVCLGRNLSETNDIKLPGSYFCAIRKILRAKLPRSSAKEIRNTK